MLPIPWKGWFILPVGGAGYSLAMGIVEFRDEQYSKEDI